MQVDTTVALAFQETTQTAVQATHRWADLIEQPFAQFVALDRMVVHLTQTREPHRFDSRSSMPGSLRL